MSWFKNTRRNVERRTDKEGERIPPPFPTVSTFLGIAAAMIVIWLLVQMSGAIVSQLIAQAVRRSGRQT